MSSGPDLLANILKSIFKLFKAVLYQMLIYISSVSTSVLLRLKGFSNFQYQLMEITHFVSNFNFLAFTQNPLRDRDGLKQV